MTFGAGRKIGVTAAAPAGPKRRGRRQAPEISPATASPAPFSITRQFPGQGTLRKVCETADLPAVRGCTAILDRVSD